MVKKTINNEQGFVLIASLMMLVVLMIIGIAATNTTNIELQISGNDKAQKMDFYVAESGWQVGAQWLDSFNSAPPRVNASITDTTNANYSLIRNYGDGADGDTDIDPNTADGTLTSYNIPYWYRVNYEENKKIPGNGGKYRRYVYTITSVADDGQQRVEVRVEKPFKTGY